MYENILAHWAVQEIIERALTETDVNLWPKIEAHLPMPITNTHKMNQLPRRIRMAVGIGLTLLIVGLFIFVPPVRGFAEDIIQRMGLAFVNTQQFEPDTQTGLVEASKVAFIPPSLSVEEVRAKIKFKLLLPTWLPESLEYTYYSIHPYDPKNWEGSGIKVGIEYAKNENFDFSDGLLRLNANDGPISAPPLLAESREKDVRVNGQNGIYVHGGWRDDGHGDPEISIGPLQWDDLADDAYLTWMQDGVTYLLEAHNLGLGLEDLQRIAASMSAD